MKSSIYKKIRRLFLIMLLPVWIYAENPEIILIDPGLIEKSLTHYTEIPTISLYPAEITSLQPISTSAIVITISNLLPERTLSVRLTLELDGKKEEEKRLSLSPGEKIPVLYQLSKPMTSTHEIKAILHCSKPKNLTEWEKSLIFKDREHKEPFTLKDIVKIHYTKNPLPITGNISAWKKIPPLLLNKKEDIFPVNARAEWKGPEDLSAAIYFAWDLEYLYLGAMVSDNKHHNTKIGSTIWDGDALQCAFVPYGTEGTPPLNLGVALASGTVQAFQWAGEESNILQKGKYLVTRKEEEKKTFYEMKLPLDRVKIGNSEGKIFACNLVIFDGDENEGQDYWIQISPGLAGGWNPGQFKRFILWK
ncbi:MAG: hypothetical protein WDA18_07655 [Candidatus Ratteibacteria bacterium]|jgi:hypothetical protein